MDSRGHKAGGNPTNDTNRATFMQVVGATGIGVVVISFLSSQTDPLSALSAMLPARERG